MSRPPAALSISQVERDTGLTKDTLRVWERRYGFPLPERDARGERQYDVTQVEKLRVIKRLLDIGKRPGKLVRTSLAELNRLGNEQPPMAVLPRLADAHLELIRLLKIRDAIGLQQYLAQLLLRQGLHQFVLDTIAPMNTVVGDAWARGEIAVFDEHLYTEQMQAVLRNVILNLPRKPGAPRVLLTTLPKEQHSLGLLMVEALLTAESVTCIALGTQTPLQEIAPAARAHSADIVGLSFSTSFSSRAAIAGIATLHRELPTSTTIWIGGKLVSRIRQVPPSVLRFAELDQMLPALSNWRSARTAALR